MPTARRNISPAMSGIGYITSASVRHGTVLYRGWLYNSEPRCIAFGGVTVEAAVGREVLRVVQAAVIEASLLAQHERSRQRDNVLEAIRRELEAARYAADRARRQYDASHPENRLLAAELERR